MDMEQHSLLPQPSKLEFQRKTLLSWLWQPNPSSLPAPVPGWLCKPHISKARVSQSSRLKQGCSNKVVGLLMSSLGIHIMAERYKICRQGMMCLVGHQECREQTSHLSFPREVLLSVREGDGNALFSGHQPPMVLGMLSKPLSVNSPAGRRIERLLNGGVTLGCGTGETFITKYSLGIISAEAALPIALHCILILRRVTSSPVLYPSSGKANIFIFSKILQCFPFKLKKCLWSKLPSNLISF